jgi:alpha-amylase/alpha-mannosidase (GH57 family)
LPATIANKLIRELQRKLPTHSLFETYQKDFLFYQQVLAQQPKDKNKIYSSSPTCPLSRFLESLKSDLRCLIIGSIAARLLHSLRFLAKTGFIFCKIPKVFCGTG